MELMTSNHFELPTYANKKDEVMKKCKQEDYQFLIGHNENTNSRISLNAIQILQEFFENRLDKLAFIKVITNICTYIHFVYVRTFT